MNTENTEDGTGITRSNSTEVWGRPAPMMTTAPRCESAFQRLPVPPPPPPPSAAEHQHSSPHPLTGRRTTRCDFPPPLHRQRVCSPLLFLVLFCFIHSKACQPSTTLSQSTPPRCRHNLHFDGDSIGPVSSQLFLSLLTQRSSLSFLPWAFFSASAPPFTSLPAASSAAVAPTDHTRPQPTKVDLSNPLQFSPVDSSIGSSISLSVDSAFYSQVELKQSNPKSRPVLYFLDLNHGRFLNQRPARRRRRGRSDC